MNNNLILKKLHMGKAKCAVDLGDGSERGEYVNQDYILSRLGRPHRAINLMYCYYPLDEGFPGRASVVHKNPNVSFAWDYPYDDYFTYKGGIHGNTDDEPFKYMREIRSHGQDVILTLTIDPNLSDEYLIHIAKELIPFGRMQLRINHEATGNWFSFNKRCSYKEVADFYVRFHRIIKKYAPHVKTILCIGGIEDLEKTEMEKEEEFSEAVRETDIWSVDKYMALHWGWPYDVAEPDGNSHGRSRVSDVYERTKRSYLRFKEINGGVSKPMVMSEFNADGDVTGPYEQCEMISEFLEMLKNDADEWFDGFTFYQFRDRGRLGLEIEDPNNENVGIEQPAFQLYKKIISEDYFSPAMTVGENVNLPATLRWGGSEDSDGLSMNVTFLKDPVFCELYFDEDDNGNYMIEIAGRWFYKSPKVKFVDLMPAFFDKKISPNESFDLKIFAPPATGENDPSQGDGWEENYFYEIKKLPKLRVLYNAVKEV